MPFDDANLPMLFAIGSAVELASESGTLSAAVSVFITNITISIGITPEMASQGGKYAMVVGIPTLQMGFWRSHLRYSRGVCYNRRMPEKCHGILSFILGLLLPYVSKISCWY